MLVILKLLQVYDKPSIKSLEHVSFTMKLILFKSANLKIKKSIENRPKSRSLTLISLNPQKIDVLYTSLLFRLISNCDILKIHFVRSFTSCCSSKLL